MKINIKEVPAPMFTSFTIGGDDFNWNSLKEDNTVTVEVVKHTKTRIDTTFQKGQYRVGINLPMDGFKVHTEERHSWFSGNNVICHYFVKSKKQDFEVYKNYVKLLLHKIIREMKGINLEELNVNLICKEF